MAGDSDSKPHDGIDRRGFLKCMAWAGTGVVWTIASGGIPEWIGGGGVAVARGDEAALGGAIASLLSPDAWAGASVSAFTSARSYRVAERAAQLRAIYAGAGR